MENNNFKPFPFDQLKQKKEPEKTAVAIAYEPGEKAPKILATGKGQVAEKKGYHCKIDSRKNY